MKVNQPKFLHIDQYSDDKNAQTFCYDFIYGSVPKYIFGINEYAISIASNVDVDGFIDEFTTDKEFLGKPIIQLYDLPEGSMVVSVVVLALPLTALKKLRGLSIRHLDYFRFWQYSGINLKQVIYHSHDDFVIDFNVHRLNYDWIYSLLTDEESHNVLTRIINFRLSNDLKYMESFENALDRQYFESFLELRQKNEIFVDVGCFDGFTTIEFIKQCPNYKEIHVFEPEPLNMSIIKDRLKEFSRINYHDYALSNETQTLKFKSHGSSSCISVDGEIEIKCMRLDDVVFTPFSFLKMDIEGAEAIALEGAKQSIIKHHPRLAISVYHRFDDLWRIPRQVLSYRDDYQVYLRHYTEGVTETVMYFVPNIHKDFKS